MQTRTSTFTCLVLKILEREHRFVPRERESRWEVAGSTAFAGDSLRPGDKGPRGSMAGKGEAKGRSRLTVAEKRAIRGNCARVLKHRGLRSAALWDWGLSDLQDITARGSRCHQTRLVASGRAPFLALSSTRSSPEARPLPPACGTGSTSQPVHLAFALPFFHPERLPCSLPPPPNSIRISKPQQGVPGWPGQSSL